MEWDEPQLSLPQELGVLCSGVQAGTRRLSLPLLLDSLPRFTELPVRRAENNFRGQGNSSAERQLRSYQQSVLHAMRIWTEVYRTEDEVDANTNFRMA